MRRQTLIPFLPGYMFDGKRVVSTGVALPPTQHINPETGEVVYYVKPIFDVGGATIGLFIRHKGIIDWVDALGE